MTCCCFDDVVCIYNDEMENDNTTKMILAMKNDEAHVEMM